MKQATVHNLSIQLDLNQSTTGSVKEQINQAIEQINSVLQRESFGMAAQIIPNEDGEYTIEITPDFTLSNSTDKSGRRTLECEHGTYKVRPYFDTDPDDAGVSVYSEDGKFLEQFSGAKVDYTEELIRRIGEAGI